MSRRWMAGALFFLAAGAVLASEGRPAEGNAAQVLTIGPYSYDGSGNIKSIGPNSSQTFVYDAFGRITSGTVAGHSQTYTYDRFGNLLTMTTDGSAVTLGVDPGGSNRMNQSSGSAWGQYDSAGRMVASSSSGTTSTFAYDGAGMVRQATVGGVTKFHVYSASDERIASITISNGTEVRSDWTVRDSSGRVLRRLERNGGVWAWREDYIYRGGQLLASEVDTAVGTQHFHLDHLGTPRLITGAGGVEVSRHTYYPFGQELVRQTAEKQKFTGHERDFGSGAGNDLDYMHARYYAVAWGRFLSKDPSGRSGKPAIPQSWNRYAYAHNNPVKMLDPDGKETIVFIVGSSNLFKDLSGGFGHVGIWVSAGKNSNGLSFGGDFGFRKNGGYQDFVKGYVSEGRTVHAFRMKSTPEQDRQMLAAIAKKQYDSGTFNIISNNCTTSTTAVLQAGGLIPQTSAVIWRGGVAQVPVEFTRPEELEDALEESPAVQQHWTARPASPRTGSGDPFHPQGAIIDGVWTFFPARVP